jgi:uncharacterized protein
MYDGPVIDAHIHPLVTPDEQLTAEPHPPEAYRALVQNSAITRAAGITVAPVGNIEATRARNDAMLKLADDSAGFFLPVCSVHPADGEAALTEIERIAAAGSRWLKLHPVMQHFDVGDPAVSAVVRRATEFGLPVLFHADSPVDADEPGKYLKLVLTVPESRLILAHALGPSFTQLLAYSQLNRYPWWQRRVWVDISATVSLLAGGPYAEQFLWTLRKAGIDRVMFGSNYPVDDPLEAIEAATRIGFTDAELRSVMHDNAAELLGS